VTERPVELDDFSRAWHEKMYGSRATVQARLFCYLPFVLPLLHAYPKASALDLRCGQGEWLETLSDAGFTAQGVDEDSASVAHCQHLGLQANAQAALLALQACADQSYALISGFGLAEALPFETLRHVVQESLRVLKPGGLLILQAVNPENIVASSNQGFLDPTRRQPIPRALLAFVPEHAGFALTKAIPLHEQFSLAAQQPVSLLNVLQDVSPLYAVIAQKSSEGLPAPLAIKAFDYEYGLSLETLASLFDQQIETKIQDAAASAARAEAALAAIHGSFMWRVTRPIRWAEQQVEQLQEDGVGTRVVAFVEKMHRLIVRQVLERVTGRRGFSRVQRYLEKVSHQQALVVAQRHALLAEQRKIPLAPAIIQQAYQTRERIETLSPEAQEIYQRLQQVGSTQRSNPAPQVDVPAAQPDVVVDQPKTASNSAAQPRS
jgi:O-antigen chain-terminating methyltransferase